MMTTLFYKGKSFGVLFNPFHLQLIQQAYKNMGEELELKQDDEVYDFRGIPADNLFSEDYQLLINELKEYDPKFRLENVKVDFANYPCSEDILGLTTAFGCRYQCSYCPIHGMGYVVRDKEVVKQELEELCRKVKYFEFYDNNVLSNPDFLDTIECIPKGVTWGALINITEVTPTLFNNLKKMYSCGCRNIYFGLETFNAKDLEYFKKPYYVAGVNSKSWMEMLQDIGFNLLAFIIRGLPNEKPGELDELMQYLDEHNILYNISRFMLNGEFVKETKYLSKEYLDGVLDSDFYTSQSNFRKFINCPL